MGAQQSLQKNLSEYKNHDRIGVYRQLEDNDRNLVQISRPLPSENLFKEWVKNIENIRKKNQPKEVVYLPLKYQYKQTSMCGSGGTLHLIFDRWESFLRDQVASRRKNQHFYTEQEIWFILYSLLRVGVIYQPMGVKIGDLHPSNIVVTPEGFIRVITRHSIPLSLDNYQKIVEEINSDVYLAPQQMDQEAIQRGAYNVCQPCKADAFSLGMVMLEVATLQNCSYLYIRNPLRLSTDKFNAYKKMLQDKYSSLLYKTIMTLLELDPKERKNMTTVYQVLQHFEQQIEDLRPFGNEESKAESVAGGDRSVDNSRTHLTKKSNAPYSPPSNVYYSFTKQ